MRRFFSIPELVELVCKELGYLHFHRKDLAALARTATVFHHPALDVLWQQQNSPINVILCMPADLWESEELVKRQRNFALSRPITPSDLERPLIYSRRVKSLSMDSYDLTLDFFRVFEVMKPFLPHGILFPNLRHLDLLLLDERAGTILPYLSFALITSISLGLGSSWSTIPDLPIVNPALKHLGIFTSTPNPAHLLPRISICVRKLIQIEKLTLPTLDRAAYDHLSTLPTLRSLIVTKRTTPDLLPSIPPHPAGRTGFPALRNLKTESMTVGFVTEVVNGFSNTPLRSLNAITAATGPDHFIQHFFAALSAHLAHSALEQIALYLGVEGNDDSDIDSRALSHLLCFSNLRMVTLYVCGEFIFDDATVWDMARAWPNLVKLELTHSQYAARASPPRIMTLASLRAFATHCPELSTLTLTFDATVVPPFDEQPLVQKKLLALGVSLSPIASPALVGRFLTENFPNIERIQPLGRFYGLWKEVEDVVKRGGI
ncbi:hypothetical protein C8J57DRAFT_1705157 [Mycena rebaudengoi]|nr:hypothetical protein C8J57DRAFT_1705157 [Mycena rebaudengoi]